MSRLKIINKKGEVFNALYDDKYSKEVCSHKWYIQKKGKKAYVRSTQCKERFYLHRLILGFPKDKVIDHINGNTLDNRESNLRACLTRENSRNRGLSKNNTSGFKGVYFSRVTNSWAAHIKYMYKSYSKSGFQHH